MEVRIKYGEKDFDIVSPSGDGNFNFEICNIIRYTNRRLIGIEQSVKVPENGIITIPGIKINTEHKDVLSKAENNSSPFMVDLNGQKLITERILLKDKYGKLIRLKVANQPGTKKEDWYPLIGADISGKRPKYFNVETMKDKIEEKLKNEDNSMIVKKVKKLSNPNKSQIINDDKKIQICSIIEVDGRGQVIVCGFKDNRPYVWKEKWGRVYLLTKNETKSIILTDDIAVQSVEYLQELVNKLKKA